VDGGAGDERTKAHGAALERAVTALVVNYRTLEFTQRCVETLLAQYPSLPLMVIDNGSEDRSTAFLRDLESERDNVRVQFNERNIHHGPALDQGMRLATTPFVFTLDSDCEVLDSGFIEEMLRQFNDPQVYAVGELRYKNRFGYTYAYWYEDGKDRASWIPYVHPYAMLVDRRKYFSLPPFIHHGAPCIRNMGSARSAGYSVSHFPVYDFVRHHRGGTSATHGFGIRGRLRLTAEFYLNKLYDRLLGDRSFDVRYPTHVDEDRSDRPGL
jgi:glycosyltransferase involved in cell wall biosynthesis